MAKNEKLRVRVKCKGVVPDSTDGGPSTVSKVTSKGKTIIKQKDYCPFAERLLLELQTNNPDTIVKLEVCNEPNPNVQTRIFKRIYICLGALKLGFKSGKRELLGLDGCFLKGPHPGQILTTVDLDSNNGIYSLAYAVVEPKTKSSWTWFLEFLGCDLDLDASCNFSFGIIPAIAKEFPHEEHRWCLRHIRETLSYNRGEKNLEITCGECYKYNH
uniref:MULE transposase domain-containing protein n=1 Tax=Lactuca sativa TaxID=4236 RepID=A0A9R1W0A3_LACSA|nr:hypothetical protein LSAT_V11C400182330 [Lactuca sativa]